MELMAVIAPFATIALFIAFLYIREGQLREERMEEREREQRHLADIIQHAFVQLSAHNAVEATEIKTKLDDHAQQLEQGARLFEEELARMQNAKPPLPPKPPIVGVRTRDGQRLRFMGEVPTRALDGAPESSLLRKDTML